MDVRPLDDRIVVRRLVEGERLSDHRETPIERMAITSPARRERLARIALAIEESRRTNRRRLLLRAMKLWRRAEAHHCAAACEAPQERIH